MSNLLNSHITNKRQEPNTWFFVGASELVYVWQGGNIINVFEPAWWHTDEVDESVPYYGAPANAVEFYKNYEVDLNEVEEAVQRNEVRIAEVLKTHIYREASAV